MTSSLKRDEKDELDAIGFNVEPVSGWTLSLWNDQSEIRFEFLVKKLAKNVNLKLRFRTERVDWSLEFQLNYNK